MGLGRSILLSIFSYLPGYQMLLTRVRGRKATARYCYSVWLRHLVCLFHCNVRQRHSIVVELGPGDSLGVGLAALISGSTRYLACDSVRHTNLTENLPILDELVELFANRSEIPNDTEFPDVFPKLSNYKFPEELIKHSVITEDIDQTWVDTIRSAIRNPDAIGSCIKYWAPWQERTVVAPGSVDLVLSQAVLEHIDELDKIHRKTYEWLRIGGIASHQIDYRSHRTSSKWNGHWTYSEAVWKLLRGRRRYWINRVPHSTHMRLIKDSGFAVIGEKLTIGESHLGRNALSRGSIQLRDHDIITQGALIQVQKLL